VANCSGHPRCLTDREPGDAREKHLEADNIFVEGRECSEGTEMVFIAQAFDDLIEFCLGRFRLPQTILANHRDQILLGELVLFHHVVLPEVLLVGSGVEPRPKFQASGSLRASPATRHGCRGN